MKILPLACALALATLAGCAAPHIDAPRAASLIPVIREDDKIPVRSFEVRGSDLPIEQRQDKFAIGDVEFSFYPKQAREFITQDVHDYLAAHFRKDPESSAVVSVNVDLARSWWKGHISGADLIPFVGVVTSLAEALSETPVTFAVELSGEVRDGDVVTPLRASFNRTEMVVPMKMGGMDSPKVQELYRREINGVRADIVQRLDRELLPQWRNGQLVTATGRPENGTVTIGAFAELTGSPATLASASAARTAVVSVPAVAAVVASGAAARELYQLDRERSFNVLDDAFFDPATGELALVGHRDDRFEGPKIPYLQLLAALLESPHPEFSLKWTSDSSTRVDRLFSQVAGVSDADSDRLGAKWGRVVDEQGMITRVGTFMMPAAGVYPIAENRKPGTMGVEVVSAAKARVRITRVARGSAADRAGLQPGDQIQYVRNDRRVFIPWEFYRQVRFAGAGSKLTVVYDRDGRSLVAEVTLDADADPNPWRDVSRYDVISLMYRANDEPAAAKAIEAIGLLERVTQDAAENAGPLAMTFWLRSLHIEAAYDKIMKDSGDKEPTREQGDEYARTCARECNALFKFPDGALLNAYEALLRRGLDPGTALEKMFSTEFDRLFKAKVGAMLDAALFRPGEGFQIPPEAVEEEYRIHPEMTPEFLGIPPASQLARVMFESDYLCKQLTNRPDLKREIPEYQTEMEYQVKHPETNRADARGQSAERLWISVASADAAQSTNGQTLAVRDVKLQFNMRQTDMKGNDLPGARGNGYDRLLTGLYDRLEEKYATLHELRETAKLAVISNWMRQKDPAVRLPAEGRWMWQRPDKVPGLVYLYLTTNLQHQFRIFVMAEGGVSLVVPPAAGTILSDPSVVDLRGSSLLAPVLRKPDAVALPTRTAGPGAFAGGWVAPVSGGTKGQEAVVLASRAPEPAVGTGFFGTGVAHLENATPNAPAKLPGSDTDARRQLTSIHALSAQDALAARSGFDTSTARAGSLEVVVVGTPTSVATVLHVPEKLAKHPKMRAALDKLRDATDKYEAAQKELAQARDKLVEDLKQNPRANMAPVLDLQGKVDGLAGMIVVEKKEIEQLIELPSLPEGDDPLPPPPPAPAGATPPAK